MLDQRYLQIFRGKILANQATKKEVLDLLDEHQFLLGVVVLIKESVWERAQVMYEDRIFEQEETKVVDVYQKTSKS